MSDPLDNPEHAAAVDALLATLDAAELALKANALNASHLREEDVLKLTRMVAMTAMRMEGREVLVAGIGAVWKDSVLKIFHAAEVASVSIPNNFNE